MPDILCPYCLSKLSRASAYYECEECGTKMEVKSNTVSPRCTNGNCSHRKRIVLKCKNCDAELPPRFLDYQGYVPFAMVGLPGSGKTNYIISSLYRLQSGRMKNVSVQYMDNDTKELYKAGYKSIYSDHKPVDSTNPGEIIPYLYRVQIEKKGLFGKSHIESMSMTIFDGAGEDIVKMAEDTELNNYIINSKYILFLIDPTTLDEVETRVVDLEGLEFSRGNRDSRDNNDTRNLITDMASFIKERTNMKLNSKIKIPVGIVFTKMDLLFDTADFNCSTVREKSEHFTKGGFDSSDAELVSQEIETYLQNIGADDFLDVLRMNFENYRFFGVSSFGNTPADKASKKNSLNQIDTHRVEDPIMWIFSEEGIINKIK